MKQKLLLSSGKQGHCCWEHWAREKTAAWYSQKGSSACEHVDLDKLPVNSVMGCMGLRKAIDAPRPTGFWGKGSAQWF